eukprot:GFYU01003030.1.p1 GENE.GFYU01003030.1~~GFYU01003030.1.p1  ORF type:complete len:286 (+),score=64.69 GFYU01003030.1:215-1072(+)
MKSFTSTASKASTYPPTRKHVPEITTLKSTVVSPSNVSPRDKLLALELKWKETVEDLLFLRQRLHNQDGADSKKHSKVATPGGMPDLQGALAAVWAKPIVNSGANTDDPQIQELKIDLDAALDTIRVKGEELVSLRKRIGISENHHAASAPSKVNDDGKTAKSLAHLDCSLQEMKVESLRLLTRALRCPYPPGVMSPAGSFDNIDSLLPVPDGRCESISEARRNVSPVVVTETEADVSVAYEHHAKRRSSKKEKKGFGFSLVEAMKRVLECNSEGSRRFEEQHVA